MWRLGKGVLSVFGWGFLPEPRLRFQFVLLVNFDNLSILLDQLQNSLLVIWFEVFLVYDLIVCLLGQLEYIFEVC